MIRLAEDLVASFRERMLRSPQRGSARPDFAPRLDHNEGARLRPRLTGVFASCNQ